jgi:hypothetical protein
MACGLHPYVFSTYGFPSNYHNIYLSLWKININFAGNIEIATHKKYEESINALYPFCTARACW